MCSYCIHIGLSQPAEYELKIQGRFSDDLRDWFQGEVRCRFEGGEQQDVVTVITGTVIDQSALHGLITRIRDLGLVLLFVSCNSAEVDQNESANRN
jgi:hypothetical protein